MIAVKKGEEEPEQVGDSGHRTIAVRARNISNAVDVSSRLSPRSARCPGQHEISRILSEGSFLQAIVHLAFQGSVEVFFRANSLITCAAYTRSHKIEVKHKDEVQFPVEGFHLFTAHHRKGRC